MNLTGRGSFTGHDDPRRANFGQHVRDVPIEDIRYIVLFLDERFGAHQDGTGGPAVAGVSYATWRRVLRGDRSALRPQVAARIIRAGEDYLRGLMFPMAPLREWMRARGIPALALSPSRRRYLYREAVGLLVADDMACELGLLHPSMVWPEWDFGELQRVA